VAWQRIAPHLLKQDAPHGRVVWYWDNGPLVAGGLLLWLDTAGRVARFQLTHTPFPGTREYVATWRQGGTLRLGQVGDGGDGPHHKMAPVVRYERPDAGRLAALAAYFARNAAAVEPRHREAVAAVLGTSAVAAEPEPPARRARAAPHAVSGKNGGRGLGTAATDKRR
jgi:hypothetical protein